MNGTVQEFLQHACITNAVMVTYQPDATLLANVRAIAEQVAAVVIVDNCSTDEAAAMVMEAAGQPRVQLIRNDSNLGIAAALNIGIRHALNSGCEWVATFDHDSLVPISYFSDLLAVWSACAGKKEVGMLVPGTWLAQGSNRGKPTPAGKSGSSRFVHSAANSGCVIRADVFSQAGYFDENLFIDYVDTDFCLRLQANGFRILSVSAVTLGHELGAKQTRNLLGYQLSFRVHSAWRYYYIMRNRLVMFRRYALSFPRWALRDFTWMLLELARMACLEKHRRRNLACAFRGLADGVRGRTGRHPDFPPRLR